MEDFKKKGEDINKGLQECRRKLAEAQKKVRELSLSAAGDAKAEITKTQNEEKKLKKEEREWAKKLDEHNNEEKRMPWNVDTLSKDGFSKVSELVGPINYTDHYLNYCRLICYREVFMHVLVYIFQSRVHILEMKQFTKYFNYSGSIQGVNKTEHLAIHLQIL